MSLTNDTMVKAQDIVDEWHEYWEHNGEPHPSSNAYLSLNREFFFRKGMMLAREDFDEVGELLGGRLYIDFSREHPLNRSKKVELAKMMLRKAFGMPEPKHKNKDS